MPRKHGQESNGGKRKVTPVPERESIRFVLSFPSLSPPFSRPIPSIFSSLRLFSYNSPPPVHPPFSLGKSFTPPHDDRFFPTLVVDLLSGPTAPLRLAARNKCAPTRIFKKAVAPPTPAFITPARSLPPLTRATAVAAPFHDGDRVFSSSSFSSTSFPTSLVPSSLLREVLHPSAGPQLPSKSLRTLSVSLFPFVSVTPPLSTILPSEMAYASKRLPSTPLSSWLDAFSSVRSCLPLPLPRYFPRRSTINASRTRMAW